MIDGTDTPLAAWQAVVTPDERESPRRTLGDVRAILEAAGLDIALLGADAFPDLPDIPETESSLAGNALLKAREIARITGLPAIADDSGLCVDALNGMPGILSARWSGRHGDDKANLHLLLGQLSDVPDRRRGAAFHCAAARSLPGGYPRPVLRHSTESR